MLAIVPSKASVSSIKGYSRLKWASRGADTSRSLSLLKACLYIYSVKVEGLVFSSKTVKRPSNFAVALNKVLVEVIEP